MSMSPSLQSAREKLLEESKRGPPFPLEELPKDRTDPLWTAIARQYNLSLVEQSALKNFVCPSTRPDNNKDKSNVDSEISISRSSLEELAAISAEFWGFCSNKDRQSR
ncbi:hypothetical protein ACA910_019776 [Epithemia clementina (nom. ined.)]